MGLLVSLSVVLPGSSAQAAEQQGENKCGGKWKFCELSVKVDEIKTKCGKRYNSSNFDDMFYLDWIDNKYDPDWQGLYVYTCDWNYASPKAGTYTIKQTWVIRKKVKKAWDYSFVMPDKLGGADLPTFTFQVTVP
ncbi:hypothetical protein [Actinoplanes sp. NPDC051859]|uniref:hypothetical protein n=1 Tax=Actinoplanes sp. NPDC051859 TaxID=3363909 RepID=UPI00378B094E